MSDRDENNCQHGVLVHDCYYCSGGNPTRVTVTNAHYQVIDAFEQKMPDHFHAIVVPQGCFDPDCSLLKESAPVEPPVPTNVQKAIDYLTSDHDLDTRQEVVGKTLEILRSAPPELRAAALTKMIDSIWKPEDRSTYDNPSQKRGAEKLRDAILEPLSQEGGK